MGGENKTADVRQEFLFQHGLLRIERIERIALRDVCGLVRRSAFGSFLSASGADQTDGEERTGKLACMDEHPQQADRAKARERSKYFVLLFPPQGYPYNPFKSVLKIERRQCAAGMVL